MASQTDGAASQVQQAKVLMKDTKLFGAISAESRRKLNEFVKASSQNRPQSMNLAEVAQRGVVTALYLPYRVASADAAHVSVVSLARHFDRDQTGQLTAFNTGRDQVEEIFATLDLAIRAFMVVCVAHTNIAKDKEGNEDMVVVTDRLAELPLLTL